MEGMHTPIAPEWTALRTSRPEKNNRRVAFRCLFFLPFWFLWPDQPSLIAGAALMNPGSWPYHNKAEVFGRAGLRDPKRPGEGGLGRRTIFRSQRVRRAACTSRSVESTEPPARHAGPCWGHGRCVQRPAPLPTLRHIEGIGGCARGGEEKGVWWYRGGCSSLRVGAADAKRPRGRAAVGLGLGADRRPGVAPCGCV